MCDDFVVDMFVNSSRVLVMVVSMFGIGIVNCGVISVFVVSSVRLIIVIVLLFWFGVCVCIYW